MIENIKGVIRFNDSISPETIGSLISEIESKLLDFQEIIIYFTSGGGSITDSRIAIDYMNRYKERIELVGIWSLASCAFDFFLFFNGKCWVMDSAYAILHLGDNEFSAVEEMDKKSFAVFNRKSLNKENAAYLQRLKPLLNDNEYKRVKAGEDVYLNTPRIKQILKRK